MGVTEKVAILEAEKDVIEAKTEHTKIKKKLDIQLIHAGNMAVIKIMGMVLAALAVIRVLFK